MQRPHRLPGGRPLGSRALHRFNRSKQRARWGSTGPVARTQPRELCSPRRELNRRTRRPQDLRSPRQCSAQRGAGNGRIQILGKARTRSFPGWSTPLGKYTHLRGALRRAARCPLTRSAPEPELVGLMRGYLESRGDDSSFPRESPSRVRVSPRRSKGPSDLRTPGSGSWSTFGHPDLVPGFDGLVRNPCIRIP